MRGHRAPAALSIAPDYGAQEQRMQLDAHKHRGRALQTSSAPNPPKPGKPQHMTHTTS